MAGRARRIVVLAVLVVTPAHAFAQANCQEPIQQAQGGSSLQILANSGMYQPIAPVGAIANVWLQTQPSYTTSRLSLVAWDPTSLIPDPTTVALRTMQFDWSDCQYNRIQAYIHPAVVTTRVAGLADPPRSTVALQYQITWSNAQSVLFDPAGPETHPVAWAYFGANPPMPLGGTHPVVGHQICDEESTTERFVVQSVMTTTASVDTSAYEVAQRFRVPRRTEVHWIELAFTPSPTRGPKGPMSAWIVDAAGGSVPGTGLPIAEAPFNPYVPVPTWGALPPFADRVVLEPGHDYWLVVRTDHDYRLMTRLRTGTESTDFVRDIGSFHRRSGPAEPYTMVGDQSLSFRLIGAPVGLLSASEPVSPRFGLRAAPNPSRSDVVFAWSGAEGPVRIEVLDVRGRRVAFATAPGEGGRWVWPAADATGTYFARLTDAAGRVAVERVVRVR